MYFKVKQKRQISRNISTPSEVLRPTDLSESQKRSAKGLHLKEDDSAFPIWKLGWAIPAGVWASSTVSRTSKWSTWSFSGYLPVAGQNSTLYPTQQIQTPWLKRAQLFDRAESNSLTEQSQTPRQSRVKFPDTIVKSLTEQSWDPNLLHICERAMSRAKKGQQKVPILKKTIGLCPSRSYYSMMQVFFFCP